MKTLILTALATLFLAAPSVAVEPIKGSLNYETSMSTLNNTPVGSVTFNDFYNRGTHYREIYVVGPDHRLNLVNRTVVSD